MRMAAMLHPTASITFPTIGQTLTRLRTIHSIDAVY